MKVPSMRPGVLEEQRRGLVHCFELLEALLDGRLDFVGFEDLDGDEVTLVANQRVHTFVFFLS